MKSFGLNLLLLLLSGIQYCKVNSLIDVNCSPEDAGDLMIQTKLGKIKGACTKVNMHMSKPQTVNVYTWLSVPFAEPPIKDLRFKPPKPAKPWSNVLDGTKLPNACSQFMNSNMSKSYESSGVKISEDCLYLNIYAPQKAYQKLSKVPILVFIQGDKVFFKYCIFL